MTRSQTQSKIWPFLLDEYIDMNSTALQVGRQQVRKTSEAVNNMAYNRLAPSHHLLLH